MSTAITIATVAAVPKKVAQSCDNYPQYYKTAYGYAPAGQFGVDFVCLNNAGVCTYYQPNPITQPNYFVPCHPGTFIPININKGALKHSQGSR